MKLSQRYLFWQKVIKVLGVLALIASGVFVIWLYRQGILNDSNELKSLVKHYRFWGPLIFILIQIIQVVFPVIPGGVTTVAGFLIFGPVLGFIYNYIGILVGVYFSIGSYLWPKVHSSFCIRRNFLSLRSETRNLLVMSDSSFFAWLLLFLQQMSWS